MFTQPPFPNATAIKKGDAEQTSRKVPRTTNVDRFSTEPSYTPLPIRFTVVGYMTKDNFTNLNISGLVLPPVGSLFVAPVSIRNKKLRRVGVNTRNDQDMPQYSFGPTTNGFVIFSKDLASGSYLDSGRLDNEAVWTVGTNNTTYYDPEVIPFLDTYIETYNVISNSSNVDTGVLGKVLAHDNLQFGFKWRIVPMDFASDLEYLVYENQPLEVTFVIWANPYWKRLSANDGNP